MKQGKTLAQLGRELQRQRQNRQDFLADTRSLEMQSDSCGSTLRLSLDRHDYNFTVGDNAHQQIATRLNIPFRYYQKMQASAPDLLENNVNRWFNQTSERRMIRVLDGNVRAFLSDRYRRLKAEVKVGDVVQAGSVVSNSEVGLGSLRVEPLVFRLVCKNGLICKDLAQKKYHVGRQVNVSDDSAYELYSDETLAQDDKAFFMKVQDIVRCAVDEARFALTVDKLREATQIPLKHDPVKSVELLADKFQLTENERGDILRQLFIGADNSRYGLINAVTAASKIAKSYERATDLERIGGEILALPVPQNLLPPPTVASYQSLPEYESIPA